MSALRVLLVEDSATDAKLVLAELGRIGRPIEHQRVETEPTLRAALTRATWDVLLCDWRMPMLDAMTVLRTLRELELDLPVLIVSGSVGEELAVAAMRAGAHDYVLKDNLVRLVVAVEREIREAAERAARRVAESAVRREQARFRALVESGHDGVTVTRGDGVLLYVSPAAARIIGRPADELVGKYIVDYFHPDERVEAAARFASAAHTPLGATVTGPRRVVRADGSIRELEVTATNRIEDPAVGGVVANFRDVTDTRRTSEALTVAQTRFARLFESGIIGIGINESTGRVLEANDRFLEMLGYTREDLREGRIDWRRLTPKEWARTNDALGVHLEREGVATPREKEYFRKDGSRVPVLIGVARLDATTNLSVTADLTDTKRAETALRAAESQLRHSQKMEAVGQLAGGIAHDFNNILSVIMSYAEMTYADLPDGDPRRPDVDQIRIAAMRAAGLTRQLLMFSRRQVVELKVFDLNELVDGVRPFLARLLGEEIELVAELGPPARIRADRGAIEQVVMNLAVNARDAMPRGGRLELRTALSELAPNASPSGSTQPMVTLTVTDTGTGMDEAMQLRIFEPFFTTKGVGKGTGLGLSTVFGIVGQSSGRIAVQSAIGAGTSFRIDLPRVDDPLDVGVSPASAMRGGVETVLLVEDDDALRSVARGILVRAGYQVLDAARGERALALVRACTDPIQLLITDVVMPQMRGPDLAQHVVGLRPEMRVLLMSGYTDDEVVRHDVADGQVAFLHKPFTPASLLQKVREVLDRPGVAGPTPTLSRLDP